MSFKTDIEIAQETQIKHIREIAQAAGVDDMNDRQLRYITNGLGGRINGVPRDDGFDITVASEIMAILCLSKDIDTDTEAELKLIEDKCNILGVNTALSEVWGKGGEDGRALAEEVVRLCEQPNKFAQTYPLEVSIEDKLNAIARKVYRADGVDLMVDAKKQAKRLETLGFGDLPVCMAKTQYSFSDNAALLGAPKGFRVTVRNLKVSAGAGFIVALTGDIMTMPGLPKVPSAEKINVDSTGKISGLF